MESPRASLEKTQIERYGQRFTPLPAECAVAINLFDGNAHPIVGYNVRRNENIHRIHQRHESDIQNLVPNAKLVFDVKVYRGADAQRPHSFIFQYENDDQSCATMEFDDMSDNIYSLGHRFVQPTFRNKGLGTRVYVQAEEFFAELARQTGKDVTLQINTGQEGVMRWAEALGFRVRPQDEETYNEIRNHPERFFKADYFDENDASRKTGYIFRKGESQIKPHASERILFEKLLRAK